MRKQFGRSSPTVSIIQTHREIMSSLWKPKIITTTVKCNGKPWNKQQPLSCNGYDVSFSKNKITLFERRRKLFLGSNSFYSSSSSSDSSSLLDGSETNSLHHLRTETTYKIHVEQKQPDNEYNFRPCLNHRLNKLVLYRLDTCQKRYASTSSIINNYHYQTNTIKKNEKSNNEIPFLLADIGEGIKEVELMKWYVSIGQKVEQFDKICLIQSDKATVEITSRYDGIVTSLNNKNIGDMIQVGEPLLFLRLTKDTGEEEIASNITDRHTKEIERDTFVAALEDSINSKIPSADVIDNLDEEEEIILSTTTDSNTNLEQVHATTTTTTDIAERSHSDSSVDDSEIHASNTSRPRSLSNNNKYEASPAVRKLINDYGINATTIHGTGPKGRILKSDLLSYLEERGLLQKQQQEQPQQKTTIDNITNNIEMENVTKTQASVFTDSDEDEIVTLKGYNRLMYKAMTESLKIPQMGYSDEIVMNTLIQCRHEINRARKPNEEKISMLALLIKACSLALKEYPIVNSIIHDDKQKELCIKKSHNIGIAMNTPRGLVVPVIQQCDILSVLQIQKELNRLKYCASTSVLAESDLSNATITLSNIGSIGGTHMNPVVVTPTIAIGAFGKMQTVPRFRATFSDNIDNTIKKEEEEALLEHIYAAHIMYVSWSADHRYLDGATLSQFSNAFKHYIERPFTMLMDLR